MGIALTDTASLHPLVLPARAGAAPAHSRCEPAAVRDAVILEHTGRGDDALGPGENRPMLRISEDVDATALAYAGDRKKDLT